MDKIIIIIERVCEGRVLKVERHIDCATLDQKAPAWRMLERTVDEMRGQLDAREQMAVYREGSK